MLRIELSVLSAQELKRLLDMARARNQSALAEQLLSELAARPATAEDWSPIPMAFAQSAAPKMVEADTPPRRNGAMMATAALAAFVSAAVTWGISVPGPVRQPNHEAGPAPRAAVVLASLAPVASPPGSSATTAQPGRTAPGPVRVARAAPSMKRDRTNPCYDLPTAAERLVCGYPTLAAQDRQLRAAYERALAAGADRRDLDRTQAQWRDASSDVSDRAVLGDRYARRIRELEAVASAAPPPPVDPPF